MCVFTYSLTYNLLNSREIRKKFIWILLVSNAGTISPYLEPLVPSPHATIAPDKRG